MSYKLGEVWFAEFPFEDNQGNLTGEYKPRPVVVLDEDHETYEVLSVKVTKTDPREGDEYDTPIVYWQHSKLRFKSTARVAKTTYIPMRVFKHKIGDLHPDDLKTITDLYMKFLSEQE